MLHVIKVYYLTTLKGYEAIQQHISVVMFCEAVTYCKATFNSGTDHM